MWGDSSNSVGVYASSPVTALQVEGVASFSRSGLAIVAAGTASIAVKNVALTSSSLILAALQSHQAGCVVAAVVPSVSKSKLTIYLSTNATTALNVAWFIVG